MTERNSINRTALSAKTLPKKISFAGDRPLRILSLDGGGIKGIFTTHYLARLEELLGNANIGDYFDLIAGTSTGGMIALGLAKDLSARELRYLYLTKGEHLFPRERWNAKNLEYVGDFIHRELDGKWHDKAMFGHDIFFSKYDSEPLRELMAGIVGEDLLGDAKMALCIPSVNAEKHEPAIFKTPHHPDFEMDWKKSMLEVGMGTSAAPTYFKPSVDDDYILLDGALIGNNPIMMAVVDILSRFHVKPDEIRVLSIGTGAILPPLTKRQIEGAGLLAWKNAVDHFNFYQSKNAIGQTCLLVGPQHVHRIEPKVENCGIDLGDYKKAAKLLPNDGTEQADRDFNLLKDLFFSSMSTGLPFHYGSRKLS
ncbi:MAG: patatin-like phospholipase family protein [Hyphomonadaceae bacterium]|nr:patatin-like phospholipase family protein [Hyphomonadaceae bacterium]